MVPLGSEPRSTHDFAFHTLSFAQFTEAKSSAMVTCLHKRERRLLKSCSAAMAQIHP